MNHYTVTVNKNVTRIIPFSVFQAGDINDLQDRIIKLLFEQTYHKGFHNSYIEERTDFTISNDRILMDVQFKNRTDKYSVAIERIGSLDLNKE